MPVVFAVPVFFAADVRMPVAAVFTFTVLATFRPATFFAALRAAAASFVVEADRPDDRADVRPTAAAVPSRRVAPCPTDFAARVALCVFAAALVAAGPPPSPPVDVAATRTLARGFGVPPVSSATHVGAWSLA